MQWTENLGEKILQALSQKSDVHWIKWLYIQFSVSACKSCSPLYSVDFYPCLCSVVVFLLMSLICGVEIIFFMVFAWFS